MVSAEPCSTAVNWQELLTVDDNWVVARLCDHQPVQEHKLVIRAYSLRFTGTEQRLDEFTNYLSDQIDRFCFPPDKLQEFRNQGKHGWKEARRYFGQGDPLRDGKLGELILYLLVEAVLRAPIMSYKISLLTNLNDQVKGGDGIFVGNYAGRTAIFLGESKIKSQLSRAIEEAFESLNRFHNTSSTRAYELDIAPRMKRTDLSQAQLDYIYNNLLNPTAPEHKACITVHPVFIAYDDSNIGEIGKAADDFFEAEAQMASHCIAEANRYRELVNKRLATYQNMAAVYLDFFFLPLSDVNKFRHSFYYQIHGVEYQRPNTNRSVDQN